LKKTQTPAGNMRYKKLPGQ